MKDFRIAYILAGHSHYDDELRKFLSKKHSHQRCFAEFDGIDLADCFLLAGADARTTTEEDDIEVAFFINTDDKAGFMQRFKKLVYQKYDSLRVKWKTYEPGG